MKHRALVAMAVVIAASCGVRARAQERTVSLAGRVISDTTAVDGVRVELLGVTATTTDQLGHFRIASVPKQTVMLRALKVGYKPALLMVDANQVGDVTIAIERVPADLQSVNVVSSAEPSLLSDPSGFDSRNSAARGGTFITEREIAAKHITETEQLFHGRPAVMVDTGGIVVIKRGEISFRDFYLSRRDQKDANMCIGAQVFVDGVPMSQPFNINSISPGLIRGVEIYTGPATTPSILRTPKTVCGTVAIWTIVK
jgi:hypothetical protein